ncbi:DNA-binding XRE family transcriptional regulator [Lederbergia galactosidilyticus]|uniref:helix-turn-helix domain-containing protein n=1 Tax=Lederbergia galactosidilytica TaxID=217031 RepID=UPI001AE99F5B|nr:helix-turn-helix transcriptional regulator [Lederbergia galactosidilytica]MBP1917219.1 DNA-binding XRE family transcriptional regulator [Lederbergia galactosidilytica]
MTKKELTITLMEARNKKKMSHQDVVEKINKSITRQYYGMIEKGDRRPSVDVAKSIAKVLDLNWTIFFEVNCN